MDQRLEPATAESARVSTATPEPTLPLPPGKLYRSADLSGLPFRTTADLDSPEEVVGQRRALDAIGLGGRVQQPGFNLFVIGSDGVRMQRTVADVLKKARNQEQLLSDWVYVNNFQETRKPVAIELPAGQAVPLRSAMHELIEDLKAALPAVFQSEDYQARRGAVEQDFQAKQENAFSELHKRATAKDIVIVRTPMGFTLAPVRDGKIVPPDEFAAWSEEKRREVQDVIKGLESELEQAVRQVPRLEREHRDAVRKVNRETATYAVDQSIDDIRGRFSQIEAVVQYLGAVHDDLVENVSMFAPRGDDEHGPEAGAAGSFFQRYDVNIVVAHGEGKQPAPIVEEPHPTLGNLLGSIEYSSQNGFLVTNFSLIKAGAIHRANGGFLLLDVRSLLTEPFSWAALKRALRQREIRIEDAGHFLGVTSTVTIEPDPIPLNLKVVLFGERHLYYLLASIDPEVREHFKILADFEDDLDRSPTAEMTHARLIASITKSRGLRPIDRDGVGLVIEQSARIADHAGKLSLSVGQLSDLLVEADAWAADSKHDVTVRSDVQRAIDERIRRAARLRDRAQENVLDHVSLIDTSGEVVGQVNGLSIYDLGEARFGRPSRISCRVRPGGGKVVDIEREVELGGPIHSKGVLILSGFLAGRYALDAPMSLFASLVFEQSYGGIDGDSASSAELYALMSAISEVPLRQGFAVTGSVNQHGQIQAIGGVNEKIEGFFDICRARGLTGQQGVLIPASNVQHLMLRQDVIAACTAKQFSIFAVSTIDEGLSLLTGKPSGLRTVDGRFPEGSVNRLIEDRLLAFARIKQDFEQRSELARSR